MAIFRRSPSPSPVTVGKSWDDLPEELWESIFRRLDHERYLEPLSLVCERFLSLSNRCQSSLTFTRRITERPSVSSRLWLRFRHLKCVSLVEDLHPGLYRILHELALSNLRLKSLHLSNQRGFPEKGLREIGERIRTIKSLTCSNVGSMKDRHVVVIAELFPGLEELHITWLDEFNEDSRRRIQITDAAIREISLKLPALRVINLSCNILLTAGYLLDLLKICLSLSQISVRECGFIDPFQISSTIRSSSSLSLTCIDLSSLFVQDELLLSLSRANFKLKKLSLANCRSFTFWGISQLLQAHQTLSYLELDLEGSEFLNDESFMKLTPYLRHLVHVNISACYDLTNGAFINLLECCPSLEDIRMSHTYLGTGYTLKELRRSAQIKALKLAWNSSLSDEALCDIGIACPNLTSIDISHCLEITDVGMSKFGRSCCEIRELDIKGCAEIKSLGTGTNFPKLAVLLAAESGIGDKWLQKANRSCRRLRKLDLGGCSGVTEQGLKQMVRGSKWLRELNLRNCSSLNVSVDSLMGRKSSLRRVIFPSKSSGFLRTWEAFTVQGCLWLPE